MTGEDGMMTDAPFPIAEHDGCFSVHFALYADRLEYENPALGYRKCLMLADVAGFSVSRQRGEQLRVEVRCARAQNEAFTVADNDEGNFLLCAFAELCAGYRRQLQAHGYAYEIDVKTCWNRTVYAFVLMLFGVLCAATLWICPLGWQIPTVASAAALLLAALFFYRRHTYRDMLSIGEVFDLEQDDEKLQISVLHREEKRLSECAPAEKCAAQQERLCRTLDAVTRSTASDASYAVRVILSKLVRRRVGADAAHLTEQQLQALREQCARQCAGAPTGEAEDRRALFAALKIKTERYEPCKKCAGGYVWATVENTGTRPVDGFLLARVRWEGTPVGDGYLLLPPGGIAPGERCVLRCGVSLPRVCEAEHTAVWYEAGELWPVGRDF